ncbi:MAG: hypothetical protein KF681_06025 [Bdellovibrionaceae bacterium]|nr:hypothetical protein [Pseudobdellovibrionaceae bacterium]
MRTLKDFDPFLKALHQSICESSQLETDLPLEQIMKQPRLMVALNHATPISWVPAISLLAPAAAEAGGDDRIAMGVVDKFFYSNPLTKPVAEYVTQSDRPLGFEELLKHFLGSERRDLVIFPEGARTFFGDLTQIQPFRSPRFIELAIRAQAPILLAVHRGSETWNLELALPREWGAFLMPFSRFFGQGLMEAGSLNLPILLKKIPHFHMKLHLYTPALYESDLSGSEAERRSQLQAEAENIRALMQEMYDSLPAARVRT